jgi:hypothetical protein
MLRDNHLFTIERRLNERGHLRLGLIQINVHKPVTSNMSSQTLTAHYGHAGL